MSHMCNFLSEKQLPELYQTFVEAFSDYVLDMSHLTEEIFLKRVRKNGTTNWTMKFLVGISSKMNPSIS